MVLHAIVAERGQVTIPKRLRDRLGITPRTRLRFDEVRGRLIVTKVAEEDAVTRVAGCLRLGRPTDAVIRELRDQA